MGSEIKFEIFLSLITLESFLLAKGRWMPYYIPLCGQNAPLPKQEREYEEKYKA